MEEEGHTESRRRHGANGKAQTETEADPISVIGAKITITGDIHSSEDLVIEGTVEGSVTCGTLVVGENGCVRGDIRTERLRLAGVVEGSIETGDLAIENSAYVKGDISYSRLRVASGGTIHGQMNCLEEVDERVRQSPRAVVGAAPPSRPVAVFEDPSYPASREGMRNAAA